MINNEFENKGSLNSISDLEFDKNSVEMLRYRPNSLSYMLGFGGILCSILAAFISLNSTNPTTFVVILKILLNIVILLGGFLCCEKTKAYSKQASIGMIVFGGICVARIFWIPLQLLTKYSAYMSAIEAGNEAERLEAAKYLGAPITGAQNGGANAWLPSSGTFRGVTAIVLLACAAAFFIIAGIIGIKKSKKLTTYLTSINEKI